MRAPLPPLPRVMGPRVMGIVNVTPDSFSDGGRYVETQAAISHAMTLLSEGADVLDIGGESTRPGASPVSLQEELDRVLPVIEGLKQRTDKALSIDTMKPEVARAALSAGAIIWNDVNALRAPGAIETAAELGCEVILMHMAGTPADMQVQPSYTDVVAEVIGFLSDRSAACEAAGIIPGKIHVDPGIGFGKTLAHNLSLIAATDRIRTQTGHKLTFGASRKRFIAAIEADFGPDTPIPSEAAANRLGGSLAAALQAARLGADMIRVHDVGQTVQALRVQSAILGSALLGAQI